MRTTWAGRLLSVLGVLVALLGAAVMVVLGPDNRLTTGPHPVETDAIAVVTAPTVISWADVRVDLLAEVPARKPIFVGVGNTVDVQDFVARTQRLEVTSFSRPWKLATRQVEGTPNLPGAPTAVDWWLISSAGLGGASISTRLPDQTVSVAVLSVGSSNLAGLQLTLAYGVEGGFLKGLALVLLGAALLWSGLLLARRGRWASDLDDDDHEDDEPDEEIVYVYVDDDGVEHEITPEEAAELGGVDEVEEIAAPAAAPTPARVPVPVEEAVVYVYVDENGVEHEVGEDELAQFEIVDDEEDRP